LEDYFSRCGLGDPDQYAVNLAKLYDRDRHGKTVQDFLSAMKRVRTVFYKTNDRIQRAAFERKILTLLDNKFKKKDQLPFQRPSQQKLNNRAPA
jgi:hypothetical protein